jgi:voltage-gated potassium channel
MTDNIPGKHLTIITIAFLTLLIGGGSAMFHGLENWTWIESFYFTVATITTVGYGDIAPSNDETRLAASLYILFGVVIGAGIIRYLVGAIAKAQAQSKAARQEETKENKD